MTDTMKVIDAERKALEAYAWPGGYPVMYLAQDGWRNEETHVLAALGHASENTCCAKCAANVAEWPDIIITGQYIHYEGQPECCEYCNGLTESAYGDPNESEA